MNDPVLVVVPTYNEAGNIVPLLERVRAAVPEADVLVVDDNSPDGTALVVAGFAGFTEGDVTAGAGGRVFLLPRSGKQGLGAAYRAGFAWGLARGYAAIVQMDADLSHPPEVLPDLLAALEDADIAVGSRYVPGGNVENWARSRQWISKAGNTYVRLVLGMPVRDTTAGFKAFRAEALRACGAVQSTSNGYCFQIENTWKAHQAGLRIAEVPITFVDRTVGTSKMSSRIVLEALLRVLFWRGEVLSFLAVGGVAYVVDVVAFNLLHSHGPVAARTMAVLIAMLVTYVGNRFITWRSTGHGGSRREIALFVGANLIGYLFSVGCLVVSHDLMGLTSRLADNISANGVGLVLGTAFRYLVYKYLVFGASPAARRVTAPESATAR